MEMINISDISFSYGNSQILDHASLHVSEGHFSALIGSNGAGKSTLMKLMLGEMQWKHSADGAGYSPVQRLEKNQLRPPERHGFLPGFPGIS